MTSANGDPTPAGDEDEDDDVTPFDALAEVLAGPDGDPERGREAARRLLGMTDVPTPVEVPRPAPSEVVLDVVTWLREVLDAEQRRAEAAADDLEPYVWLGERLGWVPGSSRVTARVRAERALLALHEGSHDCPGAPGPDHDPACPVVLHLAQGHRFDAEGWQPGWSPDP